MRYFAVSELLADTIIADKSVFNSGLAPSDCFSYAKVMSSERTPSTT